MPQTGWGRALSEMVGKADDLPADLSLQYDHYLYATQKRGRAADSPMPARECLQMSPRFRQIEEEARKRGNVRLAPASPSAGGHGEWEPQGCERHRWVKPRGRKERERVKSIRPSADLMSDV